MQALKCRAMQDDNYFINNFSCGCLEVELRKVIVHSLLDTRITTEAGHKESGRYADVRQTDLHVCPARKSSL